jgi:hypothetical protein
MTARSAVPSTWSAIATLAGVTLRRLSRGNAAKIGIGLAALPVIYASIARSRHLGGTPGDLYQSWLLLMTIMPAMFVGASIGEEIEERTSTYLWSRPIARWAVLAGKLFALVPLVTALFVIGWIATVEILVDHMPSLTSCLALAAGCLATSLIAAGIATVVPKHGMALTIGYLLVDLFIGAMPFSLAELSVTHQTYVLGGMSGGSGPATPLIAMAIVAGVWVVVGLLRIQRLET